MTKDEWYRQLFERLDNSRFRSSFHLKQKDIDYINEKGLDTIRQHAKDFIAKREAPAYIANDGKQTPMKGHPVFIAQHATATCCRECIRKWHKMQPGKELSQVQQDYLVDVIMTWIKKKSRGRNIKYEFCQYMLDNDINNGIHYYAYKLAVGSSITVIVFIYRGVLWETNQVNGLCMA